MTYAILMLPQDHMRLGLSWFHGILAMSLLLLLLAVTIWMARRRKDQRLNELGGLDAVQLEALRFGNPPHMVDLRSQDEFRSKRGHILGAHNIPYPELRFRMKELESRQPRPLVILDEDGELAPLVAGTLKAQGHAWIYFLKGGMRAWRKAGMQVEHFGKEG